MNFPELFESKAEEKSVVDRTLKTQNCSLYPAQPRVFVVVLKQAIEYLELLLPTTLAKRLVAIILLAIGMPVKEVMALTSQCERTMWTLKKNMKEMSVSELMKIKSGSGRKSKSADVEGEIVAEIESNNYHTRQEIADMIKEKFYLKISRSSVGRLLKKRHQMAEMRFHTRQSGYI